VQLYHAGKTGPYCWAAMEYVDGESLREIIRGIGVNGMLDWREVYRVAVHVGRALEELYERKIIHRAITPGNILRRRSDRVCLLGDLMLAKGLEGILARQVTQPGQLIGDVPYMPPERTVENADIDHRSDIYGLGATLYALLTGQPPFAGRSLPELFRKVRHEPPVPPRRLQRSIDKQFEECVLKMLAKRADDRYSAPVNLLRELDRIGKAEMIDAD
jgi:serine/threonine-protein kinase